MNSRAILTALVCTSLGLTACSSTTQTQANAFTGETTAKRRSPKGPTGNVDDHAMCEWKGFADRETSEIAGPGSLKPNVRRVFQVLGVGEDRHRILICREIDTNFDGVKDVVRRYNDKGESLHEESDSNYDGRIDTWITFARGRLAEMKRDTNHDGKPDVWEIYREGKLERMGVDVDADERVDRWDHDTELRRRLEEAERKKDEEAAKKEAEKRAAALKELEEAAADDEDKPKSPEKPAEKTPEKTPEKKP